MLRFERPAVLFLAGDRFAAVERLAPPPVDFARLVVAFFAPDFVEVLDRVAVERLADARFAVERFAVEPAPVERDVLLRAVPPLRADLLPLRADVLAPVDLESSSVHLPDITRCAASATASAISEPSFDALVATLLAAACAESAASRPASRILRRADGLALIAAAAAASPAASISRLIAALAILSTVLLPEDALDREDPLELFELFLLLVLVVDLAIANLPSVSR